MPRKKPMLVVVRYLAGIDGGGEGRRLPAQDWHSRQLDMNIVEA